MLPFTIDLTGKVAVVTGGSGVLCSEMAAALAACGARVALLSRTLESTEAVAAAIRAAGHEALPFSADVTDRASLEAARDAILATYGPADILINGAGGNSPKATAQHERMQKADLEPAAPDAAPRSFFDLDPAGIEFVFDVNYHGTVLATQVFARDMVAKGGGTVINISSMSAFAPLTKVMSYSSAKAAVNNLTQWLAVHLADMNVRVNAIAPGFFLTRQNEKLLQNPDGSPTARGGLIVSQTPMKRYGRPEELTGALLWLCSEAASGFVTGAIIPVDGGFAAFSGV